MSEVPDALVVWPLCPWHNLPANMCPSGEDETFPFSDKGAADHTAWHCFVLAERGVMVEYAITPDDGGVLRYKYKPE